MAFWLGLFLIVIGSLLFWYRAYYLDKTVKNKKTRHGLDLALFIMGLILIVVGLAVAYFTSYYPGHIVYLAIL